MKHYIKPDEWSIIEEGFHKEYNKVSESLFSIGNGRMGQRANFEEAFSGETLQGNYIAGVYYPDKTRVGWWKNGYPEYFAKVLNATNWIGINIEIDGEALDLNLCEVKNFRRTLNMKEGYLRRTFTAVLQSGKEIEVKTRRLCSIVDDEAGVIKYSVKPLNFDGVIKFTPYLDGDVVNEDSNYDEKFWLENEKNITNDKAYISLRTKKTDFHVCTGMQYKIFTYGQELNLSPATQESEKYVASSVSIETAKNQCVCIYKYAVNVCSENHPKEALVAACQSQLDHIVNKGYKQMLEEQAAAWAEKWEKSDVIIEGDVAAQQGIRFNIFQLHQTYTGEDERLNIGPKGFTGEKYGGSTYWDTEAYCIPFYLSTADEKVARNLLIYRHKHLAKAIENAGKLGFNSGAALYPMVTMNGEECHNEWEITFEEIHRNGAIAYAIFDYIRYTGDDKYLAEYGLEILIAISKFWAQRVNFSNQKGKYVMLGVTGPNEYENNVNNNWYTNLMAQWTMKYTLDAIHQVKSNDPDAYEKIIKSSNYKVDSEPEKWQHIIDNMYFPVDEKTNVFLQQDGFLDKEIVPVKDLADSEKPINQNWSWDRILRSCYIKQADVLQGLYFFEEDYDMDTIQRNFDFYEPITVHESSLSPCIHSILAAKLGYKEKAYEMYLRTSRLDLDDYNNDTEDGCHTTSMAGSWMSIIKGFGGMKVKDGQLHFTPYLPEQWTGFSFKIRFRGSILEVKVKKDDVEIINHSEEDIVVNLFGKEMTVEAAPSNSPKRGRNMVAV